MSLNWKSITVISFSVILIFVITFFAIGTSGFKNWDTSTWFGKGEQTEEETQLNSYTVSADMYKNLKKFSHWEDEEGKTVSSEIVYTYQSEKEKQLTAIYTDFINMEGEAWNVDSKTYNTSEYGEDGWLKMAYLTEPLTYGMSIEFTISPNTKQFIFGLSNYERVTNASEYGWCKDGTNNLDELFVPAFNIYSGTEVSSREQLGYLQQIDNLSQMNTIGKIYFSNPSCVIPFELTENYKIKIVVEDQILVYFNDVLLTADNMPETTSIDNNETYYFSFSANYTTMSITNFGYIE